MVDLFVLHFARFLNETNPDRQARIRIQENHIFSWIIYLRSPFRDDLQDYLMEGTKHLGTEQITEMLESTKKSIESP